MDFFKVEKEKKYFKDVKITRINDNKINISWKSGKEPKQVKIYWNKTPEINGIEEYITTVEGKNTAVFNDPDTTRRNYFILKAEGYTSEIIAEVLIPFKGTSNFRDIGGYKTKDGRRVKWNIFYRSDELAGLMEEDMEYLKSLGIKTILDYRSKGEVNAKPDPLIEGVENINISGIKSFDNSDVNFDMFSLMKESKNLKALGNLEDLLKKCYLEMVFDNKAFKKLMEYIEYPDKMPIVQHCTAGKDRTGVGSALILLALGVPEETVIEDYLLTNVYRSNMNESLFKSLGNLLTDEDSKEIFKVFMEVRKEYIESALNAIKERYGSIDEYLEKEYGFNKEKRTRLQQNYLW